MDEETVTVGSLCRVTVAITAQSWFRVCVRRGVEPLNRRPAGAKSPRKLQARQGTFSFSAKFGQDDVWGNESEDPGLSKNLPMKLKLP